MMRWPLLSTNAHSKQGGANILQNEGEAIAMAMALSLSTHTTEEEDNRKPAAKQYDGNKTTAINLQEPVASERDDNEGELDAMA